jgi:hypothetical protein
MWGSSESPQIQGSSYHSIPNANGAAFCYLFIYLFILGGWSLLCPYGTFFPRNQNSVQKGTNTNANSFNLLTSKIGHAWLGSTIFSEEEVIENIRCKTLFDMN